EPPRQSAAPSVSAVGRRAAKDQNSGDPTRDKSNDRSVAREREQAASGLATPEVAQAGAGRDRDRGAGCAARSRVERRSLIKKRQGPGDTFQRLFLFAATPTPPHAACQHHKGGAGKISTEDTCARAGLDED